MVENQGEHQPSSAAQFALLAGPAPGAANADLLAADANAQGCCQQLSATSPLYKPAALA